MKMIKLGLGILGVIMCTTSIQAQNDLVKFGAISRGVLQESTLGDSDTTNPNRQNGGQTVVDLRVNINPNRKTEIGTVLRLESELGGFYGAGSAISLRQLYIKGLLYDAISYELGDIYLEMSPYTMYNPDGELQANEAKIFKQLRDDLVEYDNFNIGNAWWNQGGHINGGLAFDSAETRGVQFDLYTSRIVALNTMRFLTGGRANLYNKEKYSVKLNALRMFDAQRVNPDSESLSNAVTTIEWDYTILPNLWLMGETGMSNYAVSAPYNAEAGYIVPDDLQGEFVNLGLKTALLDGKLKAKLKYLQNSANFYSVGAQTKRLDFTASPSLFLNVANNPFSNRSLNLYDVLTNHNMYNSQISGTLMAYNPMFGNAMPFGEATPNRKGIIIDAEYADSARLITAGASVAMLSDVTGVGTSEKRSFSRITANGTLDVAQLIDFKRNISLGIAIATENTSRAGDAAKVDLSSSTLDVNIEVEFLKNLYFLGGVKTLAASGNEFLYDLGTYNQYTLPTSFIVDQSQTMTGLGLRYQFSDNMYLSLKNFNIDVKDNDIDTNSYAFNQWMLFFSLKL